MLNISDGQCGKCAHFGEEHSDDYLAAGKVAAVGESRRREDLRERFFSRNSV